MSAMLATIELKPLDEPWMVRALLFVARYEQEHGTGPTWTELATHMGWRRESYKTLLRMHKLARRGLCWEVDVPRSTTLSDDGLIALHVALKQ